LALTPIEEIVLSREQAEEAARLFTESIVVGLACDEQGQVPLSKAVEALQAAFQTIRSHPRD
jgi:hypothetical protein